MRLALAIALIVHGIAHVVGFLGAWAPSKTAVLGHRFELGVTGFRILGLGWLALAVGFGIAAVGAVAAAPWWASLALGAALVSLVLCLVQLPDTRLGVVLNVIVVVWVLTGQHARWF
jgi:hypothetical protein